MVCDIHKQFLDGNVDRELRRHRTLRRLELFVYTDGVAEATDADNQLFGTERTVDALNSIPAGASQKDVLSGVRAAVDAFVKDAPQFDDLTMLGLRYNGPKKIDTTEDTQ
ncbi:MAG: SpoIIE family protein phosphatase [Clostridia bacterium]|nr:SpoIIE family protein phosphatase [Clostridia bacterium]